MSRETFEQVRRDYHAKLQGEFFVQHRISGTEVYIVRRGDSLWTMTQKFSNLPIWLLRQYNPDTDLSDLRPGTQVVMPRSKSSRVVRRRRAQFTRGEIPQARVLPISSAGTAIRPDHCAVSSVTLHGEVVRLAESSDDGGVDAEVDTSRSTASEIL